MQDPKPDVPSPAPAPKPEAPAKAVTPEAALRAFLTAMAARDEHSLRSVTLPNDGFDWLLKGERVSGVRLLAARATFASMPIRALKPGDDFTLPGGRKLVVTPEEVTESRAVLLPEGFPVPTRLQKMEGVWKVDAGPMIAARKAADAARAKSESKKAEK